MMEVPFPAHQSFAWRQRLHCIVQHIQWFVKGKCPPEVLLVKSDRLQGVVAEAPDAVTAGHQR